MSRPSKLLVAAMIGFLLALGVPAAAATVWQDMVLQYSLVAVLLVLAYEGALALVAGVAAGPVQRRLTQLSNTVDHKLGRRFSRYAREYREYVRTWQRFVDVRGLATVGEHVPELSVVFVDVGLAPRPPHQVPAGVLGGSPPDVAQRCGIHEFLDRAEPAVLAVIGGPGSGKTTLLRHVAQQAVHTGRERRHRFPILLILRDHSSRIADTPEMSLPQVLRASLPEMPVREPEGWWEQQLHDGRCVVLLDGLDEVARTEQRRTVADWIERQIVSYPKNDFVVTSRPHGYRTAVVGQAEVLQVLPFTDAQVRRFLRGWYLATERHATGTDGPDIEIRAEERAADLLDRLASAHGLHDLAVNPLLLTMIAHVHRYRNALPAGRADLYSEISQVMLWRRHEAKRLPVELPGAGKERVLTHLAFTMMNERVRDLPRPRVLEVILPSLRRISIEATPEACLAELESCGLLVERERDLYAFAHHTIGEFLAAKYIRDNGLSQVLADSVGDAWWRETTLLYVAHADADPIVQACLEDGTINALALAFDCDHSGGALAPELRARLARIHKEAFHVGADPERRRLIASVLATRHLSQLIPIGGGGRLCPYPVTTDLYWLFGQDTGHPYPDGTAELAPEPARPVLGLWYTDALAFAAWINTIIAGPGGRNTRYRLPTYQELEQVTAQSGDQAGRLHTGRAHVWTLKEARGTASRLWPAPASAAPAEAGAGTADPRTVTAADILDATTTDATRSPVLLELLLASVRALGRAIDLNATAFSLPALGRQRGLALPTAMDRDLHLAHTLTHYDDFHLGRDHSIDLAEALGLGGTFDIAGARERDPLNQVGHQEQAPSADHLAPHALVPGPDVARALANALGMEFSHSPEHARAPELAAALRREIELVGADESTTVADLVRRVVMGHALALSLAVAHDRSREPKHRRTSMQPLAVAFAETLAHHAGVSGDYRTTITLDALAEVLPEASAGFAGGRLLGTSWAATVSRQLARTAEPVFTRRRPLSSVEPVLIRVPALALAAEADRRNRPAAATALRTVAAGITLMQRRAADPESLETLLLTQA